MAQSGSKENIWTIDGGGSVTAHNCDEGTLIEDGGSNPELSDYAWYCAKHFRTTTSWSENTKWYRSLRYAWECHGMGSR